MTTVIPRFNSEQTSETAPSQRAISSVAASCILNHRLGQHNAPSTFNFGASAVSQADMHLPFFLPACFSHLSPPGCGQPAAKHIWRLSNHRVPPTRWCKAEPLPARPGVCGQTSDADCCPFGASKLLHDTAIFLVAGSTSQPRQLVPLSSCVISLRDINELLQPETLHRLHRSRLPSGSTTPKGDCSRTCQFKYCTSVPSFLTWRDGQPF